MGHIHEKDFFNLTTEVGGKDFLGSINETNKVRAKPTLVVAEADEKILNITSKFEPFFSLM